MTDPLVGDEVGAIAEAPPALEAGVGSLTGVVDGSGCTSSCRSARIFSTLSTSSPEGGAASRSSKLPWPWEKLVSHHLVVIPQLPLTQLQALGFFLLFGPSSYQPQGG